MTLGTTLVAKPWAPTESFVNRTVDKPKNLSTSAHSLIYNQAVIFFTLFSVVLSFFCKKWEIRKLIDVKMMEVVSVIGVHS